VGLELCFAASMGWVVIQREQLMKRGGKRGEKTNPEDK